jgi:large subunit ribosomal protein L18
MISKKLKKLRRHKKIRSTIKGTPDRPRFSVFRSNMHMYVQLIDDEKAKVLIQASDKDVKHAKKQKKADIAKELGKFIAKKAMENKIDKVVFDRGGVVFHGRVKSVADGAREAGLKF